MINKERSNNILMSEYIPLTKGDIRWIEKTTEEAFTPKMNRDAYIKQLERENDTWLETIHKQKN